MVLDLPELVATERVPKRSERAGRKARAMQGVSLRAEEAARERRAAAAPVSAATRGLVAAMCGHGMGSPRKGVHVLRFMMPFWQSPVDDLLLMIAQWSAGADAIYQGGNHDT